MTFSKENNNTQKVYVWDDLLHNLQLDILIDRFFNSDEISLSKKMTMRQVSKSWLAIIDPHISKLSPVKVSPNYKNKCINSFQNAKLIDFSSIRQRKATGTQLKKFDQDEPSNTDILDIVNMYPTVENLTFKLQEFGVFQSVIYNQSMFKNIRHIHLVLHDQSQGMDDGMYNAFLEIIEMPEIRIKLSLFIQEKFIRVLEIFETMLKVNEYHNDNRYDKIEAVLTQCEFENLCVGGFIHKVNRLRSIVNDLNINLRCSKIDFMSLRQLAVSRVNCVQFKLREWMFDHMLHQFRADFEQVNTEFHVLVYEQEYINLLEHFSFKNLVTKMSLFGFSVYPMQLFNNLKTFKNLKQLEFQEASIFGHIQNADLFFDGEIDAFCKQVEFLEVRGLGRGILDLLHNCNNIKHLKFRGTTLQTTIMRISRLVTNSDFPMRNLQTLVIHMPEDDEGLLLRIVQNMSKLLVLKVSQLSCDIYYLKGWIQAFQNLRELKELQACVSGRKLPQAQWDRYVVSFMKGVERVRDVKLLRC